ncbi:MAG: bifunctional phosphopantothenoylcysteine decarboxylase/phosphopantothenate--cysteine ligase CoaBC [bacterium]|uniref:Coenzyme A biosynthesis bifunctional protein CoaBC n=2 Tax=Bacteria candidate phyla TaxID=1783234 RepID=A0A101I1W9_UNCT6|nr:MAG: Phosphopantothenoylcysteine decarboxylase/phosphopantothenate/cysteine ligase [candidate division TA06 bacterium 32_111]KUK86713.1 MAG: Phosphopantothenoylcysteine decarboxylase/phosphopantothenate/cysteine ligase [candidate division TA06 bacterium 34_109]MDI6700213.1 bifunctional phosphopantothenoylcysteine decarboxylase/phosphopantothenate--cysteine ligase CoaBC [bacterium]HAF08437.1 bifunctional phosphopantothenoylcysteine decarboxylase/phosphopantothenate--cysteine ligase CoaBC [cand
MSNILLGVTGCISAYKAASLIREFKKNGDDVKVILTQNGSKFITPLTLRTLSENKVYTSLFDDENEWSTEHISLSRWADIFVVAPASANIIGKFASGIADDLLSTTFLSFEKNVLIVPTMNESMFENKATVENIRILKERGVVVMEPEEGFLACGEEGKGRFPKVEKIFLLTNRLLFPEEKLRGKRVIITGGGTFERIDPVRVITNLSSGRMALSFAKASFFNKAEKILFVHGRMDEKPFDFSENVYVESSEHMKSVLEKNIDRYDILIMAAAVADFRPDYSKEKIKKKEEFDLKLCKTEDILKSLKDKKILKIGFALESEKHLEEGMKKLKEKNLDYIVINDKENLGKEKGSVVVISKNGEELSIKNVDKFEIALKVIEWIKF